MSSERQRFDETIERFDAVNAEDPNEETANGNTYPKQLLYAKRMTAWLDKLAPDASIALRLAVRSQHIRRWALPRTDYPPGRQGYRKWRATLAAFHAETAGRIMQEAGYDEQTIERVQALLRKERLKTDPEAQLLEDVACLVFLENYFTDFSEQHDEEKLVGVIRKTWRKMSARGRRAALALRLAPELRRIVEKAISDNRSR